MANAKINLVSILWVFREKHGFLFGVFGIIFSLQCLGALFGFFNAIFSWIIVLSFILLFVLLLVEFAIFLVPRVGEVNSSRKQTWMTWAVFWGMSLLLGLHFYFYAKPTERVLGSNDEGVYCGAAVNLSRTGSYKLHLKLLDSVSPSFFNLVTVKVPPLALHNTPLSRTLPAVQPCIFIHGQNTSDLVPQFPIGYPTLLGSAFGCMGWPGLRYTNYALLVVAALLLSLLAGQWLGKVAAVAAFVLFLFFPVNVWVSQSLYSELCLMFFWMGALYMASKESQKAYLGMLVAGFFLGCSLFVKLDAALGIVFLSLFILVAKHISLKEKGFFFLGTAISALGALYCWMSLNGSYASGSLIALFKTLPLSWSIAAFLGCLLIASSWFSRKKFENKINWKVIGCLLGGVILGCAVYAYWIRPLAHPLNTYYFWPIHGYRLSYREFTFQRMGWYLHPLGLMLAVGGLLALLFRLEKPWEKALYAAGVAGLFIFCYDPMIIPMQPYAMRRFVPFAFPLLILAMTGLFYMGEKLKSTQAKILKWVWVFAIAGIMIFFIKIDNQINSFPNFAGLVSQVENVAAKTDKNSVVFIQNGGSLPWIATPLLYLFQRDCFILTRHPQGEDKKVLSKAISKWRMENRSVYFISLAPRDTLNLPDTTSKLVFRDRISVKYMAPSVTQLPSDPVDLSIPYYLFKMESIPVSLSIGAR